MRKPNPYPSYSTKNPLLTDYNIDVFVDKPFWIWDKEKHDAEFINTVGHCWFNHIIGLPIKNGVKHPIYDYESEFIDVIESNQHVWCKKARGIGATEILIRYLSWKALSSTELENKTIFIVAGTRLEFANEIKERMERLFPEQYRYVIHDSKYTQTFINKTRFKIFPSRNLKDMRGFTDVAYLFIDEADYFEKSQLDEIKYVIKSYEEKSKVKLY